MGLKLYGIGAAENVDNVGETLKLAGLDDSHLNLMRDEHEHDSFFFKLGVITFHKKIFSEKDCENAKQLRCWNSAKVPFLYAEATVADDTDHPNAKAAAEMIKFTQRPEIAQHLTCGWSIDGGIIEKQNQSGQQDENGKILSRTMATALALTTKPCNPKCRVFLENDLTKSDLQASPPDRYWAALKKSQAARSINESEDFKLYLKLNNLKKSLADYMGGHTSIRCKKCGNGVRFFKSEAPNGCANCGNHYSMSEIWGALNKSKNPGSV